MSLIWYIYGLIVDAKSNYIDQDCWEMSVNNQLVGFGTTATKLIPRLEQEDDIKGTCDDLGSHLKQKIAFSMTVCHHWRHNRLRTMLRGDESICETVVEPYVHSEDNRTHFIDSISDINLDVCTSHLSDNGFLIYTEFLNHFDNLCYYYISKSWFEKVSSSVDDLLSSSRRVIDDLNAASQLQHEIKEESDSISKMTRLIYSDAHQLALQVERGEANIVHLIDRVSQDVITRTKGVTADLDSILKSTREVQSWTSATYQMVCSIKSFSYAPLAIVLFWLYSRSQGWTTKLQLLACLAVSLFITVYSGFDGLVLKITQISLFVLSTVIWIRGWIYGRSDLQRILQEFQQLQAYLSKNGHDTREVQGNRPSHYHDTRYQRPIRPSNGCTSRRSFYTDDHYN